MDANAFTNCNIKICGTRAQFASVIWSPAWFGNREIDHMVQLTVLVPTRVQDWPAQVVCGSRGIDYHLLHETETNLRLEPGHMIQ